MEKCTDTVVNWMVRYNVINKEDKELYEYALHSLILLVSPLILAAGIGFFVGSVKHGAILVLPFIVLRKFSGGYHAKNLYTCISESVVLLFLCITLSMHVECDWGLVTATIIASVSLIVFSPIDNENRRLDMDERKIYKKITAFCVMFFVLSDITLFFMGKHVYTSCISVGILLTAGLQVPCIIKKSVNRPKTRRKCCLVQKGLKS
ncbi:MAG: accessory gene regulator B family protein [Blautia sp.]|nr:accessory gene regulator B family protein [Blautia sp.]